MIAMNFYSYDYIEGQTDTATFVQFGFMAALLLIIFFFILRFRKRRMPHKYTEIIFLAGILIILLAGIQVNDWLNREHVQNEYRGVLNQMRQLSRELDVPVDHIYTNHLKPDEVALFLAGDHFYRLERTEGDPDHYMLERIQVINEFSVKLIEK
jgi:hypothetical protein